MRVTPASPAITIVEISVIQLILLSVSRKNVSVCLMSAHECIMSVSWVCHECVMSVSWVYHETFFGVSTSHERSWVYHECVMSVSWALMSAHETMYHERSWDICLIPSMFQCLMSAHETFGPVSAHETCLMRRYTVACSGNTVMELQ